MREFETLDGLLRCLAGHGALHIYCKFLAENDNSKQQVYLGKSFEVLQLLVFGTIRPEASVKVPNFKADIPLFWVDGDGRKAAALGAQLILYPKYPEVRLSGFLRGGPLAPATMLRPVPKSERRFNNGPDGRVLFFGVSDSAVFAYLAAAASPVAAAMRERMERAGRPDSGTLHEIVLREGPDARSLLLERLREIHGSNPHRSTKLDRAGNRTVYSARNGGGYTLEALFGIVPNGRSAPDFMGWELKAYSGSRITLMTPEPDAGYYGENGVEAFLRKYGRNLPNDVIYFTGSHKIGVPAKASGHTLVTVGFDAKSKKIVDVNGGIRLIDAEGEVSAEWTYSGLVEQWARKHAAAAYVPYTKSSTMPPDYNYKTPVLLGEGTEFEMFLKALSDGKIIYDPAPKLERANMQNSKIKARSQFRMGVRDLASLYQKFESVEIVGKA
ncbi:MvaI/BcnI family restriction endonuclease [Burkholderia ubonensis]|uniref:MvaI/BcnI family restriction endonuclease n=1 Tax=Burkholderia ubonensis TaxID=101571 RepID=UPI000AEB6DFE|nr:MvaI/BcnI family restriction endonuclease [Burkholderia ubonensis]